ncbi:MAG: hypothetical protein ACKOZU_06745, partial [Planctomycetaceae bacterium]
AGIAAEPGSEINGLTMGGVGSGTIIENVQVSFGNDDAPGPGGGTVDPFRRARQTQEPPTAPAAP